MACCLRKETLNTNPMTARSNEKPLFLMGGRFFLFLILLLTYATSKPLILWGRPPVAKLTLCATDGKKIGGESAILFCLMFGGWKALKASPMLGRVFEHQTIGFKLSNG
jgi:hypothetical protein